MSFKNVVHHEAKGVTKEQATQLGLSSERTGTVKTPNGQRKNYTCKITHFADLPEVPVEAEDKE